MFYSNKLGSPLGVEEVSNTTCVDDFTDLGLDLNIHDVLVYHFLINYYSAKGRFKLISHDKKWLPHIKANNETLKVIFDHYNIKKSL